MSFYHITCPACRAENPADEPFCLRCGRSLGDAPLSPALPSAPVSAAPARRCPHCGHAAPAAARGCLLCGRALDREPRALLAPLRPGRALGGRFVVQRRLSQGGMGALYLAEDRETRRTVVVKALTDYFDPSDERQLRAARDRLAQEADTLAALRHPAIPRMVGLVSEGPQVYLAMEHIVGVDLERRLSHVEADGAPVAGRPYPPDDVLRYGVALCRVLEHLAALPHPLVHHDIKPSNVLVDASGDDVHLVDFGTAQVRVGADAALDQPSLYGTVGYAPPEQYRGQSEPRSDVYALAATLYHLATDDDPSAHPFSFPQLDALGPLGEALRDALDHDVGRRPTAAQLRGRLERLLDASGAAALRAPDGTGVPDRAALVAWCLANWRAATGWLGERLPDQIEVWWGDAALAGGLRRIVRSAADPDTSLDAALAWVDPGGAGREGPRLAADVGEIDLGRLPGGLPWRDVTIANVGRRFVSLHVFLPRWVQGSHGDLRLPPGGRAKIGLHLDLDHVYLGGRLRGEVEVRGGYSRRREDTLLRLPVRADLARRTVLARRYGLPLGGAGIAVLLWAGAGFPLPSPATSEPLVARLSLVQAASPSSSEAIALREAWRLHDSGDFADAARRAEVYIAQHGESDAARAVLRASYLQMGLQELDRRNWAEARRRAEALLAADPLMAEARQLAAQSYARPAAEAAERGDLEGARLLWQELLLRFGDVAGAGAELTKSYEAEARAAAARGDWEAAADLGATAAHTGSRLTATGPLADPRFAKALDGRLSATWRDGARAVVRVSEGDGGGRWHLVLNQDGTLIALASRDGIVRVRRAADGALLDTAHVEPRATPPAIWFSQDDTALYVDGPGGARVLDTTFWGASAATGGAPPSRPLGPLVARIRHPDRVEIISSVGGDVLRTVSIEEPVASAALSRDGRVLAVVTEDGELSIWRPWVGR